MSFLDAARKGARAGAPGGSDAGQGATAKELAKRIFAMTTKVAQYKRMVDQLGSSRDTLSHRQALKEVGEAVAGAARDLSSEIKVLSRSGDFDSHEVAARQRLVSDFKTVLSDFQASQKVCTRREAQSLPKVDKAATDLEAGAAATPALDGSAQVQMHLQQRQQMLAQKRLDSEIAFNEAVIAERDRGVAEIQGQIGEVNEIFRDLAVLVSEQGEQLDDIESAMIGTAERTQEAQRQLAKAEKTQKKSRNRLFCLLLMFAAALFILLLILLD
ncbi:unnamed protein product [Pedinophyceae sp. YPF-701]|nr:unnamed protein product [Pedinophyceae sp. YPF-701]